ncbi:MAG: DUF29 domain-containing protein [Candidatus Eremiobacteraeota bacterium]|nr:DUF29 domain-containing protein [Candidatus Eremiobacteraeota bacterium]MBC5803008.1 DUF29 domain-containing protein [Candidatus Eremiobacteraeota bacterium]MBC5820723.1 DUF29 domain-containing protein [Candidatus Eremiobacteraeota bacterium]
MRRVPVQPRFDELDFSSDEPDFSTWLVDQAAAIRTQRWHDVDIDGVAEELEDLARSQRRELRSRLDVLMAHLLKRRYQAEKRTPSWYSTIVDQRAQIRGLLQNNPSLLPFLDAVIADVYPDARHHAAMETGLDLAAFPSDNPFDLDDLFRRSVDD